MATKLSFLVLCVLAVGSNSVRINKASEADALSTKRFENYYKHNMQSLSPESSESANAEMRHGLGLDGNQKPGENEGPQGDSKSKCATGDEFEQFEGCKQVHANGLTFDCRFGDVEESKGNVMLLHGFPEWSSMWVPAMKALAAEGYSSVACNQRAYSPGASPDDEEAYNYNNLRDDIFAVATAVGFDKFHLVAHDHGAVLGWWSAGSDRGREKVLSYTAISIPHNDAFSAGLFGPTADVPQQMASQYFSMFTLKDSATIRGYAWTNMLGRWSGFSSGEDFQKALWWYNGAMAAGALAGPPVMSASELWWGGNKMMATLRWLFGDGPPSLPVEGCAASSPTGKISMPAQYICGSQDSAILCNKPFALETKNYCDADYRYTEVNAGHDPMTEGGAATKDTVDAIVWRIKSV